jgi:sialate O-acetylesterase
MEAKVKLPPLLSDNMVLQQKSNVRIWGKATPNSTVVVTPSWANKTKRGVGNYRSQRLLPVSKNIH